METLSRVVLTFLLNALWQVSLAAALAAIAARLLQRAPARYRHALWVMGLALAVLLPLTTLPDAWKSTGRSALVAEITPPESAPLPPPPSPAAAPRTEWAQTFPPGPSGVMSGRGLSRFLLMNPLRHHRRSIALPPFLAYAALSLYLFFLFYHLIRLARAWTSAGKLRREARAHELPEAMAQLVTRCQAAMGLRTVALRGSSAVRGPVTAGFFQPVIILPQTLFQTSPSEELTSALCHEMAHVRRRDYLFNLICEFVSLPLTFHPAAWLLKRRIDETRELACDEAAAGHLLSPTAYARSLVSLAHSIAPLATFSRPRYTLGVCDANILEERIMRLLDKRPRASVRRAKLLLGVATVALALAALTAGAFSLTAVENPTATNPSGAPRDFSGRWELDQSQSDLPSPAPESLVLVIEQHGSQLKVNATSRDWTASKPIAVTLFALLIPEFSTTTDNHETIQPFGPGQIRSQTRWEGDKLVTDWTLERDGQVAVTGRWVRRLSEDGNTQTVEITGHDPIHNLEGEAKAVFVKRDENARAFLGTWQAEFQGKRFLTLKLRDDGQRITGTLSPFNVNFDSSGNLAEAGPGSGGGWDIFEAKLDNGTLHVKCKDPDTPGDVDEFELKLVEDDRAELNMVGVPATPGSAAPKPLILTRAPEKDQGTIGVPGGVRGGVVHVVTGGIVGGVAGGVRGGVVRPVSESSQVRARADAETISGTVFDPSGARVPQANVAISNKASSARESTETNDTGEFSFPDLPPGTYTLSVTKVGFGINAQTVLLINSKTAPALDIVLQPGDVLQAIDVTATRVPGGASAPHKSGPQRIRVGGLIQATKLVSMKKPDYPESARAKGIQGVVLLQAVISMEGVPLSLKVISSPDPDLSQAAQDAVHEWRYEPTLLNGDPIEVVTTIAVRFHLEG